VDLDGTLLAGDTLWECIARLLLRPWWLLLTPWWLRRGRAALKRELVLRADPDPARLPYRAEVVEFLVCERAAGVRTVLATGCDETLARSIAAHLALFDGVLGSDGARNLTGANKLAAIEADADGPFDYMGDSRADLLVWAVARRIYAVAPSARVRRQLEAERAPERIFAMSGSGFASAVRAMRPHQWAKNLLVFVPLFLTPGDVGDTDKQWAVLLAFVAFCAVASAGYLLNDLLDLEADRAHPVKRDRPLASGQLPLWAGMSLAGALALFGFGVALTMKTLPFVAVLALYLALTTAYSLVLKRKLLVDVILLAGLYTLRVIGGAAAVVIFPTPWLLAFSLFIFLSLAFAKRASELQLMASVQREGAQRRAYRVEDLELVTTLGATSGYLSVLVLALYINTDTVRGLYETEWALWFVCPVLLYWISRIWFLARRGELPGDPVAFAVRDPISWASGALMACVIALAGL
jgi:4-hydroxybenzoate polyprenyltransferase